MKNPTLILLPLLGSLMACSAKQPVSDAPRQSEATAPAGHALVQITPKNGSPRTFTLEIALTPQQQEKGLSGRKTLAAGGGMIFPLLPPRPASFWMKDTLVPLDMIFVRTNGTINMIADSAKPLDRTPISTGDPVVAVVELAAGTARAMGLQVGDSVRWGPCTQKPAGTVVVQSLTDYCPG